MNGYLSETISGEAWHVQFLGDFKVEKQGLIAVFRTRKTASLFAYLAFYRGRRIPKELLVEALWPESESHKGRHSLRVAISSIRSALERPGWDPQEHIHSDRDTLEISESGFATDVGEFQDHLRASQLATSLESTARELAAAVALYGGAFLPGFGDNWILPQAMELEEAYAQAACRLISIAAQSGNLPEAIRIGRKAIGICSLREDLHVALMRAYSDAGQAGPAMKQYEELERMLDDQWGEMPGDEAQAVVASLPRRAVVSSPPSPPARPGREPSQSLLDQSAFFGRERELADLRKTLEPDGGSPRLVTLLGLGGSGKTRLAFRCSQDLRDAFEDRVWFVPLVGIEEAARLHEALLAALAKAPPADTEALDAIAAAVGAAPALLVLDNVEQIVSATRTTADFLLRSCAGLRVLVTSRVPLDTQGERLVPVVPLPLPSDYRDLAALRASPSVQLLVEAAQISRPGFAVTSLNAQSVQLLCHRLEGIPLAIELAAAKLATLTPAQVVASMGRRADLSTGAPHVPARHRSLETVIQWSLGLLDEGERDAFSRLSVCRGGFNIELATNLLGPEAEFLLQRLSRSSLLGWNETSDEVRFHMLEAVREVASQLLEADPEAYRKALEGQFNYVQRLLTRFEELTGEADVAHWTTQVLAESGNILAALEAGADGRIEAERAWTMALPLQHLLERRGRPQVWVGPLDHLLLATRHDLSPATASGAHVLLARAYYGLRDIRTTYHHCRQAVDFADRTGDARLQIEARVELATPATLLGAFDEAQVALQAAIELLPTLQDPRTAARCYTCLGWSIFNRGEEDSQGVFHQAYAYAELSGDLSVLADALTGLACALGDRRYEDACTLFERAGTLREVAGVAEPLTHCLYYQSLIDLRHGELETALSTIARSFRILVSNGIALGQTPLTICGNLMAAMGRYMEAALCWKRAEAARKRHGMLTFPTMQRDYERVSPEAMAALSPSELATASNLSQVLTDEALVERLFDQSP